MLKASSYFKKRYSNIASPKIVEIMKKTLANIITIKISHEKANISTALVDLIINLGRPVENELEKDNYIAIKWNNIPDKIDSGNHEIHLPTFEQWLLWREKFLKALKGHSINAGPQMHTFTKRAITV